MSYNRIFLIGNAGTDPEMRYTPSGKAVTTFRLAVSRRITGEEGQEPREETEWFTVTCWDRQAESVNQYVTKGKKVFAEGRLRSRSYTANDGTTRFVNEVADARVLFIDRPPAAQMDDAGPGPGEGQEKPAAPRRRAGGAPGAERRGTGGAPQNGEDVEELPW
jgi:single-strand DNA-binding protein